MKKYLILYYSKTGNSKFLAEQLAEQLEGDLLQIQPVMNSLLVLFLCSSLKLGVWTNIRTRQLEEYEEVVILGPIWGGLLIAPLRSTLKKCAKASKVVHFALSCETSDEEKNDQYGYVGVLEEAKQVGGQWVKTTEAFPTALVGGEKGVWSPKLSEKVKITEDNFEGPIKKRLLDFAATIRKEEIAGE